MLINKLSDINGCLKNNQVCKYCIGQLEKFPTTISCSIGNECSRGECCFHKAEESKNYMSEILIKYGRNK